MLNTTDKIIKHKTGLLNLAEELGNVSKACQVMGISRNTFYRDKSAVDDGGVEALFERTRRKPDLANRVDQATGDAVIKSAPTFRPKAKLAPLKSCANWGSLSRPQACGRSGCAMIWRTSKPA